MHGSLIYKKIILLIFLIFSIKDVVGQDLPFAYKKRVSKMSFMISESCYDYSPVVLEITKACHSDYDCAMAIYLWICENINFDTSLQIRTADECWKQKKGVCQGYCELFYRMAETLGIETELVYGKIRREADPLVFENHVWLQVRTEKKLLLIDPTWGAGKIVNGKFSHLKNPLLWFDVNPSWFIFTHFPQKEKYQRIKDVISLDKFVSLPYTTADLERIGLTAESALQQAKVDKKKFPSIKEEIPDEISFISVPTHGVLFSDKEYLFTVKGLSDHETLVACDKDGRVYESKCFQQDGSYTLCVIPLHSGALTLCLSRSNGFFLKLHPLVTYRVI